MCVTHASWMVLYKSNEKSLPLLVENLLYNPHGIGRGKRHHPGISWDLFMERFTFTHCYVVLLRGEFFIQLVCLTKVENLNPLPFASLLNGFCWRCVWFWFRRVMIVDTFSSSSVENFMKLFTAFASLFCVCYPRRFSWGQWFPFRPPKTRPV